MTEETIKETLDAIRKTTARVIKSKATDIKFFDRSWFNRK